MSRFFLSARRQKIAALPPTALGEGRASAAEGVPRITRNEVRGFRGAPEGLAAGRKGAPLDLFSHPQEPRANGTLIYFYFYFLFLRKFSPHGEK